MFTFELALALKDEGILVNCLNLAPRLNTKWCARCLSSPGQYTVRADVIVQVATSIEPGATGKYFDQIQAARGTRRHMSANTKTVATE